MRWTHPEHPGRRVRLAYCMNLHAARDLAGLLEGLRAVTLPLRERLCWSGSFGVGTYLPADLAARLASPAGAAELATLRCFYLDEGLDPFTFNAFPAGGFQRDGLKQRVFEPTWDAPARLEYTLDVARVAADLARTCGLSEEGAHISISTHGGRFGPWPPDRAQRRAAAEAYTTCAHALRSIAAGGPPILLGLEAEPRSSAGDTRQLAAFLGSLRAPGLTDILGVCLDTCHAAVEFEEAQDALARAGAHGPLAKLQFSSALALRGPGARPESRQLFLEMAEERFLHQVTGRARDDSLLRATDLPQLAGLLSDVGDPEAAAWLACDEWRCHFHVPVDLENVGELGTTRRGADELLCALLEAPEAWSTEELHLEIETYTWSVLPGEARGPGDLVDGLEREYEHVMAQLRAAGWHTSDDAPGAA
ncbi:MAG: xylose isomerase [Planctomycetes bacterium]|nr:xylose isomerase [Planctomycetota bacterium]